MELPLEPLLATVVDGRSVLVEGPPGIGKTHRWTTIVSGAAELGWRVLAARPAESETRLGGIALIDLFGDVTDEELARLPRPQRIALETALLRSDGADITRDPHHVVVAVASLVRSIAADSRVCIAIDDLQWLDELTAGSLGYTARRLAGSNVVFVLARRGTPDEPLPVPARELAEVGQLERCPVEPLPVDSIESMLRRRIEDDMPRPVRGYIAKVSAGNPFYALELAHYWKSRHGDVSGLPPSLHMLVANRITTLPDDVRIVVEAASALARPDLGTLAALGHKAATIADAERAEILTVRRDEVRFTHPLLGSAAYDLMSTASRAALHARIAEVVDDVEERARHRALGDREPDADTAALLDQARVRALRRGDLASALNLARLAVLATPEARVDEQDERRFEVGALLVRVGDAQTAERELHELGTGAVDPILRVRALLELARLGWFSAYDGGLSLAQDALTAAVELGHDALQIGAHLQIGRALGIDRIEDALRHGEQALRLAEASPEPDPQQLAELRTFVAASRSFAGEGIDHAAFTEAIALSQDPMLPPAIGDPSMWYGICLALGGELGQAQDLLLDVLRRCDEHGTDEFEGYLCFWLGFVALRRGRLDEATRWCERHVDAAHRKHQPNGVRYAQFQLGVIAATRGDLAEVVRIARELEAEEQDAENTVEAVGDPLLGLAALYEGRFADAVRWLDATSARSDPTLLEDEGRYLEALIGVGELEQARAVLDRFADLAQRSARRNAQAAALRCRGLLHAAGGADDDALQAFDDAAAYYSDTDWFPFDRAQTFLHKGRLLRRVRRKAAAKDALDEARTTFAQMQATGWVEIVDAEIARIGLRHSASEELTETERRVAELIGQGLTSRQVAEKMFVSPKTIEANLTRIYRKLGIASRAELGAHFAAPPAD